MMKEGTGKACYAGDLISKETKTSLEKDMVEQIKSGLCEFNPIPNFGSTSNQLPHVLYVETEEGFFTVCVDLFIEKRDV